MYYVYILYSSLREKFYIGYTADLEERVIRHNQKSKGFTGTVTDWKIVYTEMFADKMLAMQRERQIKSWKSKTKILELIKL
jgi:putative endonuclease